MTVRANGGDAMTGEARRFCNAMSEVVDPAGLDDWLTTPNDAFGGFKPPEVIERGQIDRLWEMF